MAVNFSTGPYFDDYNESKNYYKILFRAGVSVQARELTQLQTMLQKQIERHGSHVFKEGAKVFGGELSFTPNLEAVKIKEIFGTEYVEDYASELVGKTIIGAISGVKATVLHYTSATQTDPLTLYVTYTATGTDRATLKFLNNENIICSEAISTFSANEEVCSTETTNATAVGIGCQIEKGVFYVKGHFVLVNPQFHVVSKYTNQVNAKIGLTVNESVITSAEDESLLDNASGTTNFAARGADRYFIDLDLSSYELLSNPTNFIEIDRVRNGLLQAKTKTTPYNELGKQFAQRTFDINGNFVISPFKVSVKEALNDYKNEGVYQFGETSDQGNIINDDSFAALQISEGEAYVYGYEIQSTGSQFIDIEKPRSTLTVNNSAIPMEIGNYIRVTNVHSLPDVVGDSPTIVDYPVVELRDAVTITQGVPAGNILGVARIRSIEFDSGNTAGAVNDLGNSAQFKFYLFDIKMMQRVSLSGTPSVLSEVTPGTLITGSTSGAFGYVNSNSSGSTLYLTSVSGNFLVGEQLKSNNSDSGTVTGVTVTAIEKYSFDSVKQLYRNDVVDFTADMVLEGTYSLSGTIAFSGTTGTGYNTRFLTELKVGDVISAAGNDYTVTAIGSDTTLTISGSLSAPAATVVRKRSFINDQERNLSIRQLAKPFIKTLKPGNQSDTEIKFRRQFIGTTNASGALTLNAGTSTFEPINNQDYQIVVISQGTGGSLTDGAIVNVESSAISIVGAGNNSLTITSASLFGNGAQLKIITTLSRVEALSKVKTSNIGAKTKVLNKKNDTGLRHWGTSADHTEISLGVADVYKLHAVYDSGNPGQDATTPQMQITAQTGLFNINDIVTGQTSGASALILNSTSPLQYVLLSQIEFSEGEVVQGPTGQGTINSLIAGSRVITSRYLLDTGQRDNYYDIAKLVLKQKVAKPEGRLLVIYDYFSHGAGQYFDVDSYINVDYKDIPFYSSTRIDPDSPNSSGVFDLRSAIDYRPRVADVGVVTSGVRTVDQPSFDFESRVYFGTGSSDTPTPKDNSLFRYSYEYYVGRTDSLWLTVDGEWVVAKGEPGENPIKPEQLPNAMLIADIYMPPYVININEIGIEQNYQKRYRMEDIGRIEKRLNNIEYYTSLSLLESSVDTLQIKDANGLDRFKSGFLVDSFEGHKIGDAIHPDYNCSIDMVNNILRPKYVTKNIQLVQKDTGATGFSINDDIVTLDFVHEATIEQPYATRIESLTPVLTSSWVGSIKLTPSADEWFETKFAPSVTKNVDGNYNAVLAANKNSIGTIWGATQTSWSGVTQSTENIIQFRRSSSASTQRDGLNVTRTTNWSVSQVTLQRTVETSSVSRTQQGVRTTIIPRVETRFDSERIIAEDLVPFMRAKRVYFEGSGFRPYTRVYPFFDNVNVSKYCTPIGGSTVGTIENVIATLAGDWSTLSRINLHGYFCAGSVPGNTTLQIFTSTDNINYTLLVTSPAFQSQPSTASSVNTDFGSFAVPPSPTGELYVKLRWTGIDRMALDLIEFYKQDGTLINRRLYDIESSSMWVDVGVTLNDNTRRAQIPLDVARRARSRDTAEIVYKISNGAKTVLPSSGFVRTFNNDTIDPNAFVTDSTGRVFGIFDIPNPNVVGNPKFKTGDRTFRLTSSPTDSNIDVNTSGESIFTAKGVLQTKQKTFIATRNAEIRREAVTRTSTSRISRVINQEVVDTKVVASGTTVRTWRDPLAQSFQIVRPGGEFLTKVEAYFQAKDDFIPVRCELREMENGQPTSRVIPGSTVVLSPENVLVSNDGSIPTPFEFAHPIYVKEGVELCLVLISDSEDYRVFISKLGEPNIADGAVVSRQPYLGVLFKSQNSSTWTAYDNEDLKFTLYRAKFNVGQATFTLRNVNTNFDQLQEDPIQTFAGSNVIKVTHDDHHMHSTTDAVTIKGVSTGISSTLTTAVGPTATTITANMVTGMPTSGNVYFRILTEVADSLNDESYEVVRGDVSEAGGILTISNLVRDIESTEGTGALNFVAGDVIELYQANGIPFTEINKTHVGVFNQTLDYYTLTITSNAIADTYIGGKNVYASSNALIHAYQLMVPTIIHNNTGLSINMAATTGRSVNGNETPFVKNINLGSAVSDMITLDQTALIASAANESVNMLNASSMDIIFTMSTTVDNLSPVIDIERASISCHANRLANIQSGADVFPADTYVAPTDPEGDSGEAIYLTKRVQLENPATSIKCYIDAAILDGSNVQLMYKILRSDDSVEFDEIGWEYFNENGKSDKPVNPSVNMEEFKEYVYSVEGLPEFIGFAIKIRMTGGNSATPPLIKNLRAIALAV